MTQNLQIASDPDQPTESASDAEPIQNARTLIDHLNSALQADGTEAPFLAEGAQALGDGHAFARAIMRQTDQIQFLVEQINRLDSDAEVARLRAVVVDLCGALTEVTLRTKQDTSEAAGKIGLLMEAMSIIGSTGSAVASPNIASLLSGAKATAERLVSLERISTEANAAVLVLEESDVRSQNQIRDLSAGLIKLNDSVEAGRNEIAGLQQRIGSADGALARQLASMADNVAAGRGEIAELQQNIRSANRGLAQGVASLGDDIAAGRMEIADLQERVGLTDQGLAKLGGEIEADRSEIAALQERIGLADQGLARLGGEIEADRSEIAGLQERIGLADQGLARLGGEIEANRGEISSLQQRIGSADRALVQGLARLAGDLEEGRKDAARLQQRIGSVDQALGQGLATLNERTTALRDELGRTAERLASVEDSAAAHAALKDKIEVLNGRLGELENSCIAEIRSWRVQESERNAALTGKLEDLEQKNHSLIQGAEQMAVRLNAAEQTIALVVQRQKALSSVHDRVVRLLLANPDLQA